MSKNIVRHLNKNVLESFPLPLEIDFEIIKVVEEIIEEEMNHAHSKLSVNTESAVQSASIRRELLNQLVEASYGYPKRNAPSLKRVGEIPGLKEQKKEQEQPSITITGQVLDVDYGSNQVKLFISGLEDEVYEEWVSLPQELPAWALDGTVFEAELSKDVETFAEFRTTVVFASIQAHPQALFVARRSTKPSFTANERLMNEY